MEDKFNKAIQINVKEIILAKNTAGEIILSAKAKEQLVKILEFKKLADEILAYTEQKLAEEMRKTNMKKIVADDIVIMKTVTGSKFTVTDMTKLQPVFKKEVKYEIADTDAINAYVSEKGNLPEGIALRERGESIRIVKRNEE